MITKESFLEIRKEVCILINEAFDAGLKQSGLNDYTIFLVLGEYQIELEETGVNPYTIEYQLDKYKDYTRHKFLVDFLSGHYTFENGESSENEYSLNLELMVYTHIWESKLFLKSLKRLTDLTEGIGYSWIIDIPEMGKHKFVRESIRDRLEAMGINLHKVVSKGFHSSLRNAFAHSDYSIEPDRKLINLYNYKGDDWAIRNINFDDWSVRFAYSFLLSYHFYDIFYERRRNLTKYFKSDIIEVQLPMKNNEIGNCKLKYITNRNIFYCLQ